nr:polyketide cyclase SnoaL-like domain-containing protein [Tanacetum cinerariifolium]
MFGVKRNRHQKHRRLLSLWAPRGSDHEDSKAIETVFRLYEAIKHKNLNEMSEIIGHDCFCVCSFISVFKTFSGKKQVMEFFSTLMANLGNKFEFVVQPTLHNGMMVGVSWKLECSKTHEPIGTGFSFHICHIYEGKVLIRNVEMILEPLLHIEPVTLKMAGLVASITGQVASRAILKSEKKKNVYVLGSLVTLVTIFIILRLYRTLATLNFVERLKNYKWVIAGSNGVVGDTTHDQQVYNDNSSSTMRSSMVQRKSKHNEIDVHIIVNEVTIKLVKQKRINCLLLVSKVLDELQLDLHRIVHGVIGDFYSYLFNAKICEGSSIYATAITNKLIQVVDK